MAALINGDLGWLMYFRYDGDGGFSSRNPACAESVDRIEFLLNNGQLDVYPRSWCYPIETIERALKHFEMTGKPPAFIEWFNDSGDDNELVPRPG